MNNFTNQFVKDRHKAFADVLFNDSLVEMEKYCKKYGMQMPKNKNKEWIAKAGVLKAIHECTDFSEEEKVLAMQKAFKMGTNPLIKPFDYDEQIKEQQDD